MREGYMRRLCGRCENGVPGTRATADPQEEAQTRDPDFDVEGDSCKEIMIERAEQTPDRGGRLSLRPHRLQTRQ